MNVKEAVEVVARYVRELYPESVGLRLEEVELIDVPGSPNPQWTVTVSFGLSGEISPVTPMGRVSEVLGVPGGPPRHYKVLTVDSGSGVVRAMKIRKVS